MAPSPPTVLVVEDEFIVARHLEQMLRKLGCPSVTLATQTSQAIVALEAGPIDLVLLDIKLGPGLDGIAFVEEIRRRQDPAIVFVSAHCDAETIEKVKDLHPAGFIVKPFLEQQLRVAVELASSQKDDVYGRALQKIAGILNDAGVAPTAGPRRRQVPAMGSLSPRERQILDLLLSNRRVPQIAKTLQISPHTARNHLKSIYQKLNVHSQHELIELLMPVRH
jgi:DNA-binding NarL/FixJ family response regulator